MENKRNKVVQGVLLLCLCFLPLMIITGCGDNGCIRCTMCGADDTRCFVYAKGVDETGTQYTSCVGPAGVLGIGCNSKCWATECVMIEQAEGENGDLSGCVTYYNETGCIDKAGVKSSGNYTDAVTCLGISCGGTQYIEEIANTTIAYERSSCLGVSCGKKRSVEPRNYNNKMPRSFNKGCWSND